MVVDWPRVTLAALAFGALCAQTFAWRRVRPTGFRLCLWVGHAILIFGIGFGVLEVLLFPASQVRLLFVFTGLSWVGWGFIAEGRSHSPPPRQDRGRRT